MNESQRNEATKRYYSEWWENPADIRNVVFESMNEYVEARIPSGNGKQALDIGSGHGKIVSYLAKKGYEVTAIEFNEQFVAELETKFPDIKIISEDIRNIRFDEEFDLVTCIELVQNLSMTELLDLLTKMAGATRQLLINISNRNSFHAKWVKFRRWQADFVYDYSPAEFEQALEEAGFHIIHRKGIGLITPVSLLKNFKVNLIPARFAKTINKLDSLFPRICHLYYVEATNTKL